MKRILCAALFFFIFIGISGAEKDRLRILSLSAAATYILDSLGHPAAAIDEFGRIAAGPSAPPVIGRGSAISLEKIVELNIQTAIVWYFQGDIERLLRKKGIAVEVVPPLRLENYTELVLRLGRLTGKTDAAEKLSMEFKKRLAGLSSKGKERRPGVYFELYSDRKCAGGESYLGDLISAAGGRSILRKTGLISSESILEKAPDVIFYVKGFSSPEEIAARPGFSTAPAVRNGRIYPVDRRFVTEGIAPLEAIEYFKSCMR